MLFKLLFDPLQIHEIKSEIFEEEDKFDLLLIWIRNGYLTNPNGLIWQLDFIGQVFV